MSALECGPALGEGARRELRRRMIFEFGKLDPQCGDVDVLAPFPLVIDGTEWDRIGAWAEELDAEALEAEREIATSAALLARLGLPRAIRRALLGAEPRPGPRVTRFDFHLTDEGWRISEANSDVPGGFIEACGLSAIFEGTERSAGDPAAALAVALRRGLGAGGAVALVHATAFADDRQVMRFLERRLSAAGLAAHVVAPDQIRWGDGGAGVRTEWVCGAVGAIVRFFPGEWLPALGRRSGWQRFCRDGSTLLCNPGTALISQSKRFPLVWESLRAPMRRWRALLPETRDPRGVRGEDGWVLKPAMGRVGEGVLIRGVTPAAETRRAARAARRRPWAWAAQRRFRAVPVRDGAGGECYPCVGVFVIDGRAAGAYGRVARAPLIDRRARDAAVLVREVAPSRRREGVRVGQAAVV